jgi:hypothetical protein
MFCYSEEGADGIVQLLERPPCLLQLVRYLTKRLLWCTCCIREALTGSDTC